MQSRDESAAPGSATTEPACRSNDDVDGYAEALRESEAKFREMVDGLPLIVWVHDASGAQELVNETFCEFFGVTREDMTGGRWQVLMHPDDADAYTAEFLACVRDRRPFHARVRVRRADGEWRWIESWGRPRISESGKFRGFVGTSADVTEQREAEQQLRESDRRKDEFIAMLGHELRNPLAAIRSATELIELSKTHDPRLQRAYDVLERQSNHMARLVDGLLEISRIARGTIDLRLEIVDLREVLAIVAQDRSGDATERNLQLHIDVDDRPFWVRADIVRLTQIFDNLIGNAIKFTNPPGDITVTLRREAECAVARVRDTGVGIRPEMLSDIFEPFRQETQDVARVAGGLGLGLALAKSLVELHSGTIAADSAGRGAGAEFAVRLPLAPEPANVPDVERPGGAPSRRILVVEDNSDAAQMLQMLLEIRGHDVAVASNGPEAMALLRRLETDVVLCDIGLPDMSGYELALSIRADASLRELPLVALTGYGQPQDRQRTKAAGFDEHLTKPIDLAAIDAVLRRL